MFRGGGQRRASEKFQSSSAIAIGQRRRRRRRRRHHRSLSHLFYLSLSFCSPSLQTHTQKIKLENRTMNALEEMEREKNAEAAAAAEQDVRDEIFLRLFFFVFFFSLGAGGLIFFKKHSPYLSLFFLYFPSYQILNPTPARRPQGRDRGRARHRGRAPL